MQDIINRIAREILDLETLETRMSDRLDFHDMAVWSIKHALEAAYLAGIEAGFEAAKSSESSANKSSKTS